MKAKWVYGLLLAAGVCYAFFLYDRYRRAPAIQFDQLQLSYPDGRAASINDFKGKRLIVSFGASWCGNCREELGVLSELKDNALTELDVVVISDESPEKIERLSKKFHPAFTFLKLNTPFSAIGIHSIPTTYLLNTKLEVKKEQVGYIQWNDASTREHLKKLTE